MSSGPSPAFFGGQERRVDLARVNGRVFVNNASMGLYGRHRPVTPISGRQAQDGDRDAPRVARATGGAVRPPVYRCRGL